MSKAKIYKIRLTETIERTREMTVCASSPRAAGKRALAIVNREAWPTADVGEESGEWDYAGQVKAARVVSTEVSK